MVSKINNGDSGLDTRNKLNSIIDIVNSNIIIPTLNFKIKRVDVEGGVDKLPPADRLLVSWQAVSTEFLAYNPEIWLFVKRKNVRKIKLKESIARVKNKGFLHPPHLNGVKHTGAFFAGKAENHLGNPFHTEFDCPQNTKYSELPLDVWEWAKIEKKQYSTDYGFSGMQVLQKYIKFKFAIVIDADTTSGKMYGPMSDEITLSWNFDKKIVKLIYGVDI